MRPIVSAAAAALLALAFVPADALAQGRDKDEAKECKGPPWERATTCPGYRPKEEKPGKEDKGDKDRDKDRAKAGDFMAVAVEPGAACGGYSGEVEEGAVVAFADPAYLVDPATGAFVRFAGGEFFLVADMGFTTEDEATGEEIPGWVQVCTASGNPVDPALRTFVPMALGEFELPEIEAPVEPPAPPL